jgi:hypothetical protein
MSTLKLLDLPPEPVEKLKPLSPHEFDLLSIEAAHLRDEEDTAAFPTDPLEALTGVWETFRRKPEGVEDDHLKDMQDLIRVACLVLGREEDLDAADCQYLWALLDRADTLLRWETKNREEMRHRMYKAVSHARQSAACERGK